MTYTKNFFASVIALLCALGVQAQIVTTKPAVLQETSENIVLTYNAESSLGNNGLANLPSTTPVYAHIGVLTNKSTTTSDWRYVQTPWPSSDGSNSQEANTSKNQLTYVAPNTYTLNIGTLREYFGITDPEETVKSIALVFRNADGSKTGKTSSGGDIFVDVLPSGFGITLTCNRTAKVTYKAADFIYTVNTTEAAAKIELLVNGTVMSSVNDATTLKYTYSCKEQGYYEITARATLANGQVATSSLSIAWPKASDELTYPGGVPKMGAVKNADGSVTFCMAAPQKTNMVMIPSWHNYTVQDDNVMHYQDYNGDRYFWCTVDGLKNDEWYTYYYLVDGIQSVGDPYAHLVLDPYNDKYIKPEVFPDMPQYPYELFSNVVLAVYRGDIDDYTWSPFTIPSHDNLIIYELLLRDFTGTVGEANGNGNLHLAMEKIPYLKALGVNVIELLPIMEFNGNNSWGYNTNFYMAPDKAYGSPKDYKDFIDECHKNGMAVVLDIVFNQSDGLHPWYMMYNVGKNPFYNKTAPHSYSVLNDWNQGVALVQQQWTDAIKYWMTAYNVDGFRFDLTKGLADNESYTTYKGTDTYNPSRIANLERLHKVIMSVKPDGIHINENLAGAKEEIEMGNYGMLQWANINDSSCQYSMGWTSNSSLTRFLATKDGNRPWGSTVSYAESHDEERMGYKNNTYGVAEVKATQDGMPLASFRRLGSLAVQMLLTPGSKMIWQFGELGAAQTTKNSSGNDTSPKIVIWDHLQNPYVQALHDTYAALCNVRTQNEDLFAQDAEFVFKNGASTVFTNPRSIRVTKGGKEIVAFINPSVTSSSQPMKIDVDVKSLTASNARLLTAAPDFEPSISVANGVASVTVPAHSYAVYMTDTVNAIDDITSDVTASVSVRGGEGCIVINGDYNRAAAYTLSGVPCGFENLTPGLYVVNVDGRGYKVVVR
ncbi:MAG: hypothetical protein K2M79_00395 [Muribaculaceae bacterium]|nr:hypothetical protein [Muribaculaceae bacterium]